MPWKIRSFQFFTLLISAGVLISNCQSYPFEEVPSSSFSEKRWTKNITLAAEADILFIVDNSYSMAGEQDQLAKSFQTFADSLEAEFGDDYRIAIITTGQFSTQCSTCNPATPNQISCINETGESGRFQDLVTENITTAANPRDPTYRIDPSCRVVTKDNKACFYDSAEDEGTIFVGVTGCGFERGLSPIIPAFSTHVASGYNGGFLRDNAVLVVVVISDEEDCGEPNDVVEEHDEIRADICYYAAKGIDPFGETVDPLGNPYYLRPVKDYYDYLLSLKNGNKSLVKFAAIVGVTDVDDPLSTQIEYVPAGAGKWDIKSACVTPNCADAACEAYPGTRYIQLANMFGLAEGENGFIDTICQNDFSDTMEKLGGFITCPRLYSLSEPIRDPALANILINDVPIPRYSCNTPGQTQPCDGPADPSCDCVKTWTYTPPSDPPDPKALGGTMAFAAHYDPCDLFKPGDEVKIELVYVVK